MLNHGKGAETYANSDLKLTTEPQDVLIKVYDKSIECLLIAKKLYLGGNSSFDNHVATVQRVLAELIASLKDPEGEFSRGLAGLYRYLIRRIDSLDMEKKDGEPLEEAIRILTELRDAWKDAFRNGRRNQTSGSHRSELTKVINLSL